MDDPVLAWRLVSLLWAALLALGTLVAKHAWEDWSARKRTARELAALREKIHDLELELVRVTAKREAPNG